LGSEVNNYSHFFEKGWQRCEKKEEQKIFFHWMLHSSHPEKSGMEDTHSKVISKPLITEK